MLSFSVRVSIAVCQLLNPPDVVLSDATDPCSIKESAQRVGSLLGKEGLNMLVNNAGVLAHGTVQTTSSEDMQSAFNTNVMGPMNIIKVSGF